MKEKAQRLSLALTWVTAVSGLALLVVLSQGAQFRTWVLPCTLLVSLTLMLNNFALRTPASTLPSFETALYLLCALLTSPIAAAWVAGLSATLTGLLVRRRTLSCSVRSGGMLALTWLAGGQAYAYVGGSVPLTRLGLQELGQVLLLILVVTGLRQLVAALSHYAHGLPIRDYFLHITPHTFLEELALAPAGAVMAVVYTRAGIITLVLLIAPLVTASRFAKRLGQASQAIERQVKALDALHRAGRFAGASLEPESLLDTIYESISQLVDTTNFWIALYDADRRELIYEVLYDEGTRYPPLHRPYEPGQGVAAWIIEHQQPLLANTPEEIRQLGIQTITAGTGKPAVSLLGVPMMVKGQVMGAICVQSYVPNAFTREDAETLMTLASQAAVAMENARLFREVEQSQRYLRTILDSVNYAIVVTDHDGRVRLANRAMEMLLGVSEEEAVGQPLAGMTRHQALARIGERIARGGISEPETQQVELSDGRVLVSHLTPVTDTRKERGGYVVAMADVTALHELSQLKSRMIRMASHDLRNPLHLAGGFFKVLLEELSPLTDHQSRLAQRVLNHLSAMEHLIDDLLNLEWIEDACNHRGEPLDVGELVQEVLRSQRLGMEMKRQRLWSEIAGDLPRVEGDRRMLLQAVTNLVDNAIKYTPEEGDISVRVWAEGDEVFIVVRDTGIGIPPGEQDHVFDRFYRGHQPGTEHVPGSGLGLSLVQAIVQQHGGRVWVESEGIPGLGSTFGIALPAAGQTR